MRTFLSNVTDTIQIKKYQNGFLLIMIIRKRMIFSAVQPTTKPNVLLNSTEKSTNKRWYLYLIIRIKNIPRVLDKKK